MTSALRTSLTAGAVLAAGALGAGPADAHDDHIHVQLPATGCYTVSDVSGDAHLNAVSQVPNDPDLDLLGLTLRTTASSLQAFVRVSDLAGGPTTADGHRFSVDFTFNGHVFSMAASHYKAGTGAVRDGLAATGQAGKTTQLGVDVAPLDEPAIDKGFKASGLKAIFDESADVVFMELPFADIGRYGGRAFTGVVTNVSARSTIDNYAVGTVADATGSETVVPVGGKWTVGDDRCFNVPTKLTLAVTKLPAKRTVTARLVTATGQSLGGRTLTYYVNGKRYATVRTASNGTAAVRNIKPGSTVKVEFAGVTGYLRSVAQTKV